MEENQVEENKEGEEEKEEGELEEGELEDDDEEEEQKEEPPPPPPPSSKGSPDKKEEKEGKKEEKVESVEGKVPQESKDVKKDGESPKKDKKEGSEESKSKRKHKDDDDEKHKKKKKKRKHHSSEEEPEEVSPKFPLRKQISHPPQFNDDMGFDAMLQQEMFLRGRSPPPGMVSYGPHHPMYRGDFDSYDSDSDPEARMDRKHRRRHRRSRSRSRSPSRKNEAICMYYMHGSCQRGKSCPYSHDIQPQRKMELCKFYMMDCCAKREKCLYMHKDFPCKYHHTGVKCKSSDKCKFSHEPMSEQTRNILLKHIELAPKDILGDFPRLTKEAALMVVSITEAHRAGNPMDVEDMPGIIDLKGRGFKYVDKAIKNVLKKQAKAKSLEEEEGGEGGRSDRRRNSSSDSRRHGSMNEEKMSPSKMFQGKHDHMSSSKHEDSSRGMDRNVEDLVKSFRNQSYDKGMRSFSSRRSNDDWNPQSPERERGNWMGSRSEDRGSGHSGQFNNMRNNGDMQSSMRGSPNATSPSEHGHNVGDRSPENAPQNTSPTKKLGGFMARMPPKQRDFFQRIQQQHSLNEEDDINETGPDDQQAGTSNVNWYSSDEDGDGGSASAKPQWQNQNKGNMLSPSRTPPGSRTPPQGGGRFTPPDKRTDDRMNMSPAIQSPAKNPFPNINLDNIKINPLDLASVLSAVKNTSAVKKNAVDDVRDRDPRARRDPRDNRDNQDMSRTNEDISRYPRDHRDVMSNQMPDSYQSTTSNSWSRNSWDSQGPPVDKDSRDSRSSAGFLSPPRQDSDLDQRNRTGDTDLRVLPRAVGRKDDSGVKSNRSDTDMRMSNEPSIYDVDLRQLSLPKSALDEDSTAMPFKVPVHTPAKEIEASIASHAPIYYHLVKVFIPKPSFSHLKINSEDPKIRDDPRLRRMMRRNSTEESAGKSPRAPSRYELDTPFSPNASSGSIKNEPRFSEARDLGTTPSMPASRDPRAEPRVDPRAEVRPEPRVDPRTSARVDPRMGNPRGDPRTESRDPRADQMGDMRNQDPRMSGMYGGGNNGSIMDGGPMQYQNMVQGGGPGPMGGGPPLTRVDPRGRPGLLGPAPATPYSGNIPPPLPQGNVGPGMPPYMMGGQMGPPNNGGYYDNQSGGGNYPQGGGNWGGPMASNDPRYHRDIGEGPRSYTPPPVS